MNGHTETSEQDLLSINKAYVCKKEKEAKKEQNRKEKKVHFAHVNSQGPNQPTHNADENTTKCCLISGHTF